MRSRAGFALTVFASVVLFGLAAPADEPPADDQLDFFERKIRPVLVSKCYQCHAAEAKQVQGGLLLDTRAGVRAGGDSGPAVVPGDVEGSLLIQALRHDPDSYQMPPTGKLPDAVVADFEKWVALGAPDPRGAAAAPVRAAVDLEAGRRFWAFQPPRRHPPPAVRQSDWPRQPIDAFILARLEAAGLAPSPEADRRTFIRRATFDLTGLPPTPDEVRQFLDDQSENAFERLIDRLLASPRYGERWARHWLDVARYAEDNTNMGPHNGPYPHAWRYRDWVIQALNDDVPYDEFVRRQLATDLMDSTGPEDMAALGFIGLAPAYHKELLLARLVVEGRYADEWEDRVDSVGRGLLGLTLACARCHDHKYDPVPAADYYALAGVFASTRQTTRPVISAEEIALTEPARKQAAELLKEATALEQEAKELDQKVKQLEEQTAAGESAPDDATETSSQEIAASKARAAEARKLAQEKKAEAERIKTSTPGFEIPLAHAVTEESPYVEEVNPDQMALVYKPEPRDLPLYVRGDVARPGPAVPRRFLSVLSQDEPRPFTQGSGRLELAEAIVGRDNPLAARVLVNRVWMHHFGRGLVETPSNFGQTGIPPTHPELLDDLAVRFVDEGWSLKKLHRELMLSAAYRQSSENNPAALAIDADNKLLWRYGRRRLDVEVFRDAVLALSGRLEGAMGGESGDADEPAFLRRTIYAKVSRHKLSDTLQIFDFPDPAIHCDRRTVTTTPLQQLFVMNSPFMRQSATALAERLLALPSAPPQDRVRYAYELLYSRPPTAAEAEIALEFLGPAAGAALAAADDMASGAQWQPLELDGQTRITADLKSLPASYSAAMWVYNALDVRARPITAYFFSRGQIGAAAPLGDHLGIGGTYQASGTGKLLFFNGGQALEGKTALALEAWHHVVLVREGDQVRVYLNGSAEPEISGQADVRFPAGGAQFTLGARNDRFAPLSGRLAEVALFDRVLEPDEIAAHYQACKLARDGKPDDEAGAAVLKSKPSAYWPLNARAARGAKATDASGHGNHAALAAEQAAALADQTLERWARYAQALLGSNELLFID